MRENVIVLHARDAGKALKAVSGRDFTWLYLGQDITLREDIARRLGGGKRYFTGSLLQEIAREQKQLFLDFLADLGRKQANLLYWWASDTSYRNPLNSDLFLHYCYAALFEKVSEKGEWDGRKYLVVIVQDRWLYKALWQRYGGRGYRFLSGKTAWFESLKLYLKLIVARILFVCRAFRHYFGIRRLKPRSRPDSIRDTASQIYIYSWIQDRSFSENGEFRDVYFGRLSDILANDGNQVSYLTPPFLPRPLKQKCREYKGLDFTFLDSYYCPGNILRSAFTCLRIRYGGEEKWLGTLIRRQMRHEIFFPRHPAYYHAFRKWLGESAPDKVTIIYPFENQPWEKMLCLAVKESPKEIKLIGYQHSTVPPLVLNYFMGTGEADVMPLPHKIVVGGDRALQTLRNAGYGGVEIVNGGALRFEHLYNQKTGRQAKKKDRPPAVLVALPYRVDLVQELLLAVFKAFGDLEDSPRIIIKFHPAMPAKNLRVRMPDWPAHFDSTERPIAEMLGEIDLVICSSVNIILETAQAGVPAVRFRSEHTLCLDELEGLEEGAVTSCYENDMQNVVSSVLKRGAGQLLTDISDKVSDFFAPVNEEVWREVVKFK